MPCRDYYDDHPQEYFGAQLKDKDAEIKKLRKQISFAESALCETLNALQRTVGIASAFEDQVGFLDRIDYKEAGITKEELMAWREKHQELDAAHRAEAARKAAEAKAKADREKLKKAALKKLNPAEREALGLKG